MNTGLLYALAFAGPVLFIVLVLVAQIELQRARASYWREKYRMSLELLQAMEGGPARPALPPPDPRIISTPGETEPQPIFAADQRR